METLVKQKLLKGEAEIPKSSYDNYKLFLDKDINQFKRDNVKPYIKDAIRNS